MATLESSAITPKRKRVDRNTQVVCFNYNMNEKIKVHVVIIQNFIKCLICFFFLHVLTYQFYYADRSYLLVHYDNQSSFKKVLLEMIDWTM